MFSNLQIFSEGWARERKIFLKESHEAFNHINIIGAWPEDKDLKVTFEFKNIHYRAVLKNDSMGISLFEFWRKSSFLFQEKLATVIFPASATWAPAVEFLDSEGAHIGHSIPNGGINKFISSFMDDSIATCDFLGDGEFLAEDHFESKMMASGKASINIKFLDTDIEKEKDWRWALCIFSYIVFLHMRGREKRS